MTDENDLARVRVAAVRLAEACQELCRSAAALVEAIGSEEVRTEGPK